jgi:type IV pilus biogenesis protein CpaD/CtpE
MPGFGTSPFGISPWGFGSAPAVTDPPTGTTTASRYIGPVTKDYEIDATTGHIRQMPGVMQRVLLALTTLKGSSTALPGLGIVMPTRMGDQFAAEVEAAVREALRQLTIVEHIIEINRIQTTRGIRRAAVRVDYINLETGESESVETSLK